MTHGRRPLAYDSLDEVMPDVRRLLEGHRTVGNWSLAQICRHLADILRMSVDLPALTPGSLASPEVEGRKREVLDSGMFPEGVLTAPALEPTGPLDEREEAEGLRRAIAHYKASPGPVIEHPLFGFLTRQEWDRVHCIHCAHHLSFAIPTARSGVDRPA